MFSASEVRLSPQRGEGVIIDTKVSGQRGEGVIIDTKVSGQRGEGVTIDTKVSGQRKQRQTNNDRPIADSRSEKERSLNIFPLQKSDSHLSVVKGHQQTPKCLTNVNNSKLCSYSCIALF